MPLHSLTYFEMRNDYQNELKFKGVYSQNSLLNTMKDEAYVVNLDGHKSIGSHWIALYVNGNTVTYFEIKRFIDNKNIITNIFKIQTYGSMMSGFLCIGLLILCVKAKCFMNLFSPHDFKNNDKVILNYFLR